MKFNSVLPAFLLSAGPVLAAVPPAQPEPAFNMVPLNAAGTLVIRGPVPQPDNAGHFKFNLHISFGDAASYPGADKIGLIPVGAPADGKNCPFIPYDHNNFSMRQVAATFFTRDIEVVASHVTEPMMRAVKAANCVVTGKPPLSDIKGLKY